MSGCVAPTQLQMTSTPQPKDAPSTAALGRRLLLLATADMRPDGQALGRVGGRLFTSHDVRQWVDRAIADALANEGYVLAEDGALQIEPRILKAYVDSIDVAKTAVLVLEIQFTRGDRTSVKRIYRGQHAGLNWASGDGEVTLSLQRCLSTCLRAAIADVRQLSYPGNDTAWRD